MALLCSLRMAQQPCFCFATSRADLCANVDCSSDIPCRLDGECDPNTGTCSLGPVAPDNSPCHTAVDGDLGSCRAGTCLKVCAPGQCGPDCLPSPQGFYSYGGDAHNPRPDCRQCPLGRTTVNNGSTAITSCIVSVCQAGRGSSSCGLCPLGSYSAGGSLTDPKRHCTLCPANYTTSRIASTVVSACTGGQCTAGLPLMEVQMYPNAPCDA